MREDAKDQVLAVLREQEAANARGDAEGVVASLAGDLVTYDLPPPLQTRGAGAPLVDGLNRWFDTWQDGVTVTLAEPTVLIDGDLAVVFGLSRMQGIKKAGGAVDSWNRRTVVLRQMGGRWRIVHEHSSYPTQMDGSARSATDLEP